jgi:hypothetical protein
MKMLLKVEGQNMARAFANTLHGGLLGEVIARGLPLLLARRDKRGESGARGGAQLDSDVRAWT